MKKLKYKSVCLITVADTSRENGFRVVDLGNYYTLPDGKIVLVTTRHLAMKYGHLIDDIPIYIWKDK